MVRAEGGSLISDFERVGCIAIGWQEAGDLTPMRTLDAMREAFRSAYTDTTPGRINGWSAVLFKFRQAIQRGDQVVTYDPGFREYLIGIVAGDYEYNSQLIPSYANVRLVRWQGRV